MNNLKPDYIRSDFPYFSSLQNREIVYFDNAATTHKPRVVLDEIVNFYINKNSNIHRSAHKLATQATQAYESAREQIQKFISAKKSSEIILTTGATESINLIAHSYLKPILKKGDIILVSPMEHHSNIVPWQLISRQTGAIIKFIPLTKNLEIDVDGLKLLLNKRVKFVATHHVSNVTGGSQNIKKIINIIKDFNIPVLIDGAQAVAHKRVNVLDLNCDFYCFSGHKLFGPTGTGALYVKESFLNDLVPFKSGGGMVSEVKLNRTKWAESPHKMEAGTPNIAGTIGLASAIKYINSVGLDSILNHEKSLTNYLYERLNSIEGINIYGPRERSAPIFSFNIEEIHHYDIASLLAENNILIRAGHLCSQTLMGFLNIDGCLRASLSIYNSKKEIEHFIVILEKIISFLKK